MSKEEQTWSVDIRHTQLGILFKCKEEDIENHVHEFIKSELKNINWNYELQDPKDQRIAELEAQLATAIAERDEGGKS